MLPEYAELCCQTEMSFLSATGAPEDLVQQASQLGYRALAITDECSVAGVVRAWRQASQCQLQLIVGSLFRLQTDSQSYCSIVLLAPNQAAYAALCQAITQACARAKKGHYRFEPQDLVTLSECLAILLPPPASSLAGVLDGIAQLQRHFTGAWWLGQTALLHAGESQTQRTLRQWAADHQIKRVAVGQVQMVRRSDKPLHDVLCAIRHARAVKDCGWLLAPNAEQHLRTRLRLAQLYDAEVLRQTTQIAKRCEFDLGDLRYSYPKEIVPAPYTEQTYLVQETTKGAGKRYPNGVPLTVQAQLEHELQLIDELGYAAYFLTVYDMVQFARERGIACQGRGSAANSAVCYCLGITEVDPQHGNTLFERFISRQRNEPPDIDVDFEHHRREEVIQYLYRRYGHDRAALTAVHITYRPRSALRDVGKALGISPALIDQAAKSQAWWEGDCEQTPPWQASDQSFDTQLLTLWLDLARRLLGKPRHRSQHPGGFVLSDQRLTELVPIEPATMPNRYVVQWDKDDLDALGLLKVDVLGLGMLTVIRQALALTAWRRGLPGFAMQDVPRNDPATFAMVSRADTVGVFQIESRAQMNMLPKLRPQTFYDLVIQVAIVRPGPIQGGMVHPYLRRRQGLEPVTYPSQAVKSVLERTLGVPIFQEQVMKIAMAAAGFSAEQADQLRRAMAAWRRRAGLAPFKAQLFDGLLANGYTPEFAQAIFNQIEGFGEYGFPESHAASFAWLVYISAWLKCHEPEAFLVALLNAQPMGFYSASQLIQDAQRRGLQILAVDVQASGWPCQLETSEASRPAVRLGLNQVKGLKAAIGQHIVQTRGQTPFGCVDDLIKRTSSSKSIVTLLAKAGALASLSENRSEALWQTMAPRTEGGLCLQWPQAQSSHVTLPALSVERLTALDYQSLGFSLEHHPVRLVRALLQAKRYRSAQALQAARHGQLVRACGLVTLRQRPHSARGVMFLTLEDDSGQINVVIQQALVDRERHTLLSAVMLGVVGTWQTDGTVHHLLAGRLQDESAMLAARMPELG